MSSELNIFHLDTGFGKENFVWSALYGKKIIFGRISVLIKDSFDCKPEITELVAIQHLVFIKKIFGEITSYNQVNSINCSSYETEKVYEKRSRLKMIVPYARFLWFRMDGVDIDSSSTTEEFLEKTDRQGINFDFSDSEAIASIDYKIDHSSLLNHSHLGTIMVTSHAFERLIERSQELNNSDQAWIWIKSVFSSENEFVEVSLPPHKRLQKLMKYEEETKYFNIQHNGDMWQMVFVRPKAVGKRQSNFYSLKTIYIRHKEYIKSDLRYSV